MMKSIVPVVVIFLSLVFQGGTQARAESPQEPLALGVDHIYTKASSAQKLFEFFKNTINLPVAWDFKVIVPQIFSSGGISVGNLHFEFAQLGESMGTETSIPASGHASFGGVCLDADQRLGPEEYQKRGLPFFPVVVNRPDGSHYFTNYIFQDLSNRESIIFTTAYAADIDPMGRKAKLAEELRKREGGPLGIERAAEVIIGTKDLEKSRGVLMRILGKPTAPDQWQITPSDPVIKVVQSDRDHQVLRVKLKVKSLSQAVQYLNAQNALERDTDGTPIIHGPDSDGIAIGLIE